MSIDRKTVAIIFSKDRAMQLDACLRTFALSCIDNDACLKRVIFKCSDSRHAEQYATLRRDYPEVEFIEETNFHQNLDEALTGFEYVLFMVDDNLCVQPFSIREIAAALESEPSAIAFSLRLGRNIENCYSHNDTPQRMPEGVVEVAVTERVQPENGAKQPGKILRFQWVGAEYDFGYPMEVSSSVFRVRQILSIIHSTDEIKHPNGLEERIDTEKRRFAQSHPDLLCFEFSAAFCNPLNVVQYHYLNRVAAEMKTSVNSLVDRFELGFRLDVREFAGFQPKGCHQEQEMAFVPPPLDWDKLEAFVRLKYEGQNGEIPARQSDSVMPLASLTDESLLSVLTALELIHANSSDFSASWLEALGKRHREKLNVQNSASAISIATLKQRLSFLLKRNGEQSEMIAALYKDTNALHQEISTLKPALAGAKFELEQIRSKRWFRILNDASNRVWAAYHRLRDFATRLRNLRVKDAKSFLQIDDGAQLSDRQFHFRGQVVVKKIAVSANGEKGAASNAGKSIESLITFQSCCGGKWLALVRFAEKSDRRQPQDVWPKSKPLVSVVIVRRNRDASLKKAVDSALAQTWRDLEVVVVDCVSDENGAKQLADEVQSPRTRVIRPQDSEASNARNAGIAAAAGKYLCSLEADGELEPAHIEKCLLRLVIEGFDICGVWQGSLGIEDGSRPPEDLNVASVIESNGLLRGAVFDIVVWETKAAAVREDQEFWIRPEPGANISTNPLTSQSSQGPDLIAAVKRKFRAVRRRLQARFGSSIPSHKAQTLRRSQWSELWDRNLSAEKPHVLLCLPYLTIGGAEKILSQICRGLKEDGFSFTVITTKRTLLSQGNSAEWFEPATSEIFCLPECLPVESWSGFISYLIASRKVDILLQAGSSFIYDLLPELKTLFPTLKVVDNLFNEVGHTANNRKYDYLIDLHIVESNPIKSWLLARGESEDRIRVIPNGVELSRFNVEGKPTAPFDTYGRKFIVGFFGRLSKEKAPDLFVEIADRLKQEKDILFVIAGHGMMEETVRAQIADRGLEDSVKMLGFCQVETHLPCCDLLILPSRQDGRPNAVMEAMSMGVPVVASRVGGLAELVMDGYSGYLCDVLDVRQFAETILKLSQDPARCEKLRTGARMHAKENFDIRKSVAEFNKAFRGLLTQRAPAPLVETTNP